MQLQLSPELEQRLGKDKKKFAILAGMAVNFLLERGHRRLARELGFGSKNSIAPFLERLVKKGFIELKTNRFSGRTVIRFVLGVSQTGTETGSKTGTRNCTGIRSSNLTSSAWKPAALGMIEAYNEFIVANSTLGLQPMSLNQLSPTTQVLLTRRLKRNSDPQFWRRVFSGLSQDDFVMGRTIRLSVGAPFRFHFKGFLSRKLDWLIDLGLKHHAQGCGKSPRNALQPELPFETGYIPETCYSPSPLAPEDITVPIRHAAPADCVNLSTNSVKNPETQETRFSPKEPDTGPFPLKGEGRLVRGEMPTATQVGPAVPAPSRYAPLSQTEVENRRAKLLKQVEAIKSGEGGGDERAPGQSISGGSRGGGFIQSTVGFSIPESVFFDPADTQGTPKAPNALVPI